MPPTSQAEPARKASGLFASPEKRNALVCLLLGLITVVLYNPVTRHPFVNYDDDRYVTENAHIHEGLTGGTIKWAITSTEQANWHPLTWMSHALDYSLFRMNPAGHHFTSVLLHAANVILLYLLLIWATGRIAPSLFAAAWFALHPINVESVAWVAERKNLLCTLFFFLALWAYGWYARKPGWKRYLAVVALFVAGLASKPMVITLPFVLLLLDYWPLDRVSGALQTRRSWARLVAEKLPLFALSAASAVITIYAQRTGGGMRTVEEVPFAGRIANAIYAYAMYLWKMLWPAKLAPMYPRNPLAAWQVLLAAVVLIIITIFVWRLRSHRYLPVGWLWFLGILVPVIGLVQVGEAAMADRYAYIPLIGIFVMIAFGVADWAQQANFRRWLALPALAVLSALAFTTHRQIGYWQSNEELWSHTLRVTRNNFVAENNLAGALLLEGKEEEAFPHLQAAARINARDPMSHVNLGTYFQSHGQIPEAVAQYQAAIALTSDPALLAQTYANLGAAQRALGEGDAARKSFDKSLRLNPQVFNTWLGMGLLALQQGKLQEAIDDLTHSISLRPTAQAYFELGRSLAQAGQISTARGAYRQALELDPGFSAAQQALDTLPH